MLRRKRKHKQHHQTHSLAHTFFAKGLQAVDAARVARRAKEAEYRQVVHRYTVSGRPVRVQLELAVDIRTHRSRRAYQRRAIARGSRIANAIT